MGRFFTSEQLAFIRHAYEVERKSSPEIALVVGKTPVAVRIALARMGVVRDSLAGVGKRRHLLTDEQEVDVCARYVAGEDAPELAIAFGVKASYVYKVMIRHGVPRRSMTLAHRKYELNESAFDESSESALYFVGFLMADGWAQRADAKSLGKRSQLIQFDLAAIDVASVEALRLFLGSTHPISVVKRTDKRSGVVTESKRIQIRSSRLVAALARYGVVPGKTNREHATDLCAMSRHFWRGYLDGDGSCHTDRVEVVGSRELLEQFRVFLAANNITGAMTISDTNGTCQMHAYGERARAISSLLYKESTVSMARKNTTGGDHV